MGAVGERSGRWLAILVLAGVLASSSLATAAAPPAPAPFEDDYNFLFLGVMSERITLELYSSALAQDGWTRAQRRILRAVRQADYRQERQLTRALGAEAPGSGEFEVEIPRKSLRSKAAVLALARRLERLSVGVYTAGAQDALDPGTRLVLARSLGRDAQHLSEIAVLRGASAITPLPSGISSERAGATIDSFLRVPAAPDIPDE